MSQTIERETTLRVTERVRSEVEREQQVKFQHQFRQLMHQQHSQQEQMKELVTNIKKKSHEEKEALEAEMMELENSIEIYKQQIADKEAAIESLRE